MGNHSDHGHGTTKKAVFGAPLIMGLSFWVFAFFFLSFCDGPSHGASDQHSTDAAAVVHEQASAGEEHHAAAPAEATPAQDSAAHTAAQPAEGHGH